MPDNVAELRAGKWNKKEFSNARGMFGRTLGAARRRQDRRRGRSSGRRPSGCRSCSGAGGSTARTARCRRTVAADLGPRHRRAQVPIALAPSPGDVAARCRHPERAPGARPGDEGPGQRGRPRPAQAGRDVHQHRARRGRRSGRPAHGDPRPRGSASASTSSPTSRRRRPARSPIRIVSRARRRTARITSAPRPIRRRRRSPPRPCES